MRAHLGIIVFLVSWGSAAGVALAHPLLDRAVAAYEEADFAGALRTFDTAARNADLSVDELLQLFEMRALVYHALGDARSMNADLQRLAAVRPSHELSRLAPPPVRDAFERVRAAHSSPNHVELRIEETSIEGEGWVVAQVLRVPDDLVDHTTLQCSVANDTKTVSRTSRGTTASVKLPETGVHHGCSATARTRQGGVLFRANIEGARVLVPSGSGDRFRTPRYKKRTDDGGAKKKKWPWIVAVSAVVVAGGVTAGVLLSQRSGGDNSSQPGAVTVNW